MLSSIYQIFQKSSPVSDVIIPVALMLFSGFALTRVTKKLRLPNVTAYIVAGILIGPYCLNLVSMNIIEGTDFIADIALAFIAFSTGEFFKLSTLKKNGIKVCVITLLEALIASILVFILSFYILRLELSFSLVLAALASTTASASIVMTIRQTGSKGDFVNTLLQVVALDNVLGLFAYSIAISLAISAKSGSFNFVSVISPIVFNLFVLLLGGLFGVFMKWLMPKNRSTDNRLIITIALLFTFCGICAILDVSPLLGCMSMGTVYVNIADDDKLFKQVNYFSPILLVFFVRSGLNFKLDILLSPKASGGGASLLLIGILYFLVRILGKYTGAFWGSVIAEKSKEVRNYLGLALIPQAGVAIGLAALGARILGGDMGSALQTVILASSVLYELTGPGCAKLALYLSKSYSNKLEDLTAEIEIPEEKKQSELELLIERIQAIQRELPKRNSAISEEEDAFTEAAEEHYSSYGSPHMLNER